MCDQLTRVERVIIPDDAGNRRQQSGPRWPAPIAIHDGQQSAHVGDQLARSARHARTAAVSSRIASRTTRSDAEGSGRLRARSIPAVRFASHMSRDVDSFVVETAVPVRRTAAFVDRLHQEAAELEQVTSRTRHQIRLARRALASAFPPPGSTGSETRGTADVSAVDRIRRNHRRKTARGSW